VILRESREIAAPASTVFATLADFEGYARWNPWLVKAEGECREGALVHAWPVLDGVTKRYAHRVLAAQAPKHLLWCDLGWFTIFARGQRERWITERGAASCLYEVELRVRGPFAGLAERSYGRALRRGLRIEADALKAHCEGLASATGPSRDTDRGKAS
jgi:hypothetical protein